MSKLKLYEYFCNEIPLNENYEKLIIENDISNSIIEEEVKIPDFIKEFLPLVEKNTPCPKIKMGEHCRKPYGCDYQDRCKSELPKDNIISYTILPYVGKKLKDYMDEKEITEGLKNKGDKDELYTTAVEIIRSEGKASTSFLQRKLQIGYNRAARIIDMMEADWIVSKANHVGKRDVL